MSQPTPTRRLAFGYLCLVPVAVAVIGFGLGHSSYRYYLPIWGIHCCFMLAAIGLMIFSPQALKSPQRTGQLITAMLLVLPWLFISVFAGMGPPPFDVAGWVASKNEQQIRYTILIVSGISVIMGLSLLNQLLRQRGEHFYSQAGVTAILIAAPFYIMNMIFLGDFRAAVWPAFVHFAPGQRPDWYVAIRSQLPAQSAVQVAMTYLSTACFARSLAGSGWFSRSSCRLYIFFSLTGFLLGLLPESLPAPLSIPAYVVSVPAITFIMPYFMGLQLLKKSETVPTEGL